MSTLFLCGSTNSEGVRLARNVQRATGRWDRLVLMGDTHDAFEIIAADIDGDGDLDAVGTATVGGGFYWWENLGRL